MYPRGRHKYIICRRRRRKIRIYQVSPPISLRPPFNNLFRPRGETTDDDCFFSGWQSIILSAFTHIDYTQLDSSIGVYTFWRLSPIKTQIWSNSCIDNASNLLHIVVLLKTLQVSVPNDANLLKVCRTLILGTISVQGFFFLSLVPLIILMILNGHDSIYSSSSPTNSAAV